MASSQAQSDLQDQQQYEEEYLAAKRAAVEAVEIGQETLAESARQGEQLKNAEKSADQTRFALDKSARMLRGMTWSGWWANLVSKDVEEEDYFTKREEAMAEKHMGVFQYENIPEEGRAAAQAIQNYHANLHVFVACETDDQIQTCRIVCDNMYRTASNEVSKLQNLETESSQKLHQRLYRDLSRLRDRQLSYQPTPEKLRSSPSGSSPAKAAPSSSSKANSPGDIRARQQDEHLQFLSGNLDELHSIATSLHESVAQQNTVIDSLDEKSDAITDKSKMVTRRADRIIQKKSWTPVKKNFHGNVRIRHLATGLYIANDNGTLILADKEKRHPKSCSFGLWKRQGDIFGLKNLFTDKWVGQTLFGSLSCTSSKFGYRDEWQSDDDWESTRLICSSAGWGNGGYLMVQNSNKALHIGNYDPATKKQADLWRLEEDEGEAL